MPVVTTLAITIGFGAGATALFLATPRLVAALVSRVAHHLLADHELIKKIEQKAAEVELAEWSINCIKNGGLRGMRDLIHDQQFLEEMKIKFVKTMADEEFRHDLSHVLLAFLRTCIREGMEDEELKELIMVIVRETLSDEQLTNFVKGTLKGALKDRELHEATLNGAVDALKQSLPFRLPQMQEGLISPPIDSADNHEDSPRGGTWTQQQIQDVISAWREFLVSFTEGPGQNGSLAEPELDISPHHGPRVRVQAPEERVPQQHGWLPQLPPLPGAISPCAPRPP